MMKIAIAILALVVVAQADPLKAGGCNVGELKSDPADPCNGKYLICDTDGEYTVMDCPAGLVFNPDKNYCDWPANVATCSGSASTTASTTTTSTTTASTDGCTQDELLPEEDGACSGQYRQCDHGNYIIRDCPAGLAFNKENDRCDHKENVDDCNNDAKFRRVCEHYTLRLDCEDGKKIKIVNANYGRSKSGDKVCDHPRIKTTKCYGKDSRQIMVDNCQDKTSCEVDAENSVFGDPCRGTYKYLWAKFRCV